MPNMATVSAPLRELLEKNIAWHWDQEQEASFQRLKQMASSTPVLGYYDPSKPSTLSVGLLVPKGWVQPFCKIENPELMHQEPSLQPKSDMPSQLCMEHRSFISLSMEEKRK